MTCDNIVYESYNDKNYLNSTVYIFWYVQFIGLIFRFGVQLVHEECFFG